MKVRATLDRETPASNLRRENLAAATALHRMQRTLQPELLDSLPPDHPDALHNRRDLRLTNRILRTHRWLVRTLPQLVQPGERLLEIGAGTGELGQRLARVGVAVDGLDIWPRPVDWPRASTWHRADLRQFDGYDNYAVIIGNLIFHQFADSDLAALGAKLRRRARVVVACEPLRRRASQVLYRAIAPALGANHVSLHDGHVSIAAGFRGHELADALGLSSQEWNVTCTTTLLGVYRLLAFRRA